MQGGELNLLPPKVSMKSEKRYFKIRTSITKNTIGNKIVLQGIEI